MKNNFVKDLLDIDKHAYDALLNLLRARNMVSIDLSDEPVEMCVVDCTYNTYDNIKVIKIVIEHEHYLSFISETGSIYQMRDFHCGSMPYIYKAVESLIGQEPEPEVKRYSVFLYYDGYFSTTVEATNEEDALDKAQIEVESLNDLEFLDAINLQINCKEVDEIK